MKTSSFKIILITLFIKQNKYHASSVFGHTLKVLFQTIKNKNYRFILPAILHDIGKPFVAYQDEKDKLTGEYSFTDHEEKSYQMIKNISFINDWTKEMVRWHYLIRDINKSKRKGKIERYTEKQKIWDSLSKELQNDLKVFLKYDDIGKTTWFNNLKKEPILEEKLKAPKERI